jgi:hypothetical protein
MRYILWSLTQFTLLFCFIQIRYVFRINKLILHHFNIIRYFIFTIFLLKIFSLRNFIDIWIRLISIQNNIILRLYNILRTLWKSVSLINIIRLNLLRVIKMSKFLLIIECNLFLMDAMRTVINWLKLVLSQNGGPIHLFKSTGGLNCGSAIIQRKAHVICICRLVCVACVLT